MSLDCNSIKNKKSKQLIDGIESWVNKEKVGKNGKEKKERFVCKHTCKA